MHPDTPTNIAALGGGALHAMGALCEREWEDEAHASSEGDCGADAPHRHPGRGVPATKAA